MNVNPLRILLRENKKCAIGIDPGKSGAVVLVSPGNVQARRDFKEMEDISRAVQWAFNLSRGAAAQEPLVVIEGVHAMPGQGVVSMFNFGMSTGVAKGAVWCSGDLNPVIEVAPVRWQNWVKSVVDWPKDVQFDSRGIAQATLPDIRLFDRKKDHNSADAFLLALYGLATTNS